MVAVTITNSFMVLYMRIIFNLIKRNKSARVFFLYDVWNMMDNALLVYFVSGMRNNSSVFVIWIGFLIAYTIRSLKSRGNMRTRTNKSWCEDFRNNICFLSVGDTVVGNSNVLIASFFRRQQQQLFGRAFDNIVNVAGVPSKTAKCSQRARAYSLKVIW